MSQNVWPINVSTATVNQGAQGAPIVWRRLRAIIKTPVNYYLTPAQIGDPAALKTKLLADAMAANPANRIYILETLQESKNNSDAPKKQSYGYGLQRTIYDSPYQADFTFGDVNIAKHAKRQLFNGLSDQYLDILIDEDGNMIGTKGDDGAGNEVFVGFSEQDYHANNLPFDEGEGYKLMVSIAFTDPNEFNRGNLLAQKAGFNVIKTVKNLTDIQLKDLSPVTVRVVSIAPMAMNSIGTNLAAVYPTVLAGTGAALTLWKGRNRATGAPLSVTSAVKSVVNGQDVITLTWDTTNYPTTGGQIDIYLDTPANLATAGVKYFEGNTLTLTV